MERVPVTSSTVVSIGYDADSYTMEIEFTNGHIYQYFDVPQNVYDELLAAESLGKFFNIQVKGVYRYARL